MAINEIRFVSVFICPSHSKLVAHSGDRKTENTFRSGIVSRCVYNINNIKFMYNLITST